MTWPTMDAQDVRRLLANQCQAAGSQKAWAEANDLSSAYVCDVLIQRRDPGESILAALGLERVVTYRKILT
jgi:hypothetical protein